VVKNANLVSRPCWWGLLIVATSFACCVTGCERETRVTGPAPQEQSKSVEDHFEIHVGDKPVRMQIAVRIDEMQRGLMERRNLGRNEGMLFVYDRPQQMSFWMRNTPTPLDIGFFNSNGVLEEIYPLHPFDEVGVRSRSAQLSLALEMNQSWYRSNGVKPGASIDLDALAAALEARGFDAEKFGLARASRGSTKP